jgi:Flp pilus assembly protein CpaB
VRTRLLTITVAAVLALVGVVAILAYVRQANERAVNGLKAETVVVANGPIAAGTSLRQAQQGGLLGYEKVPDSSLTTAAVQYVTAADRQMVVSGTVAKGQVLLQNMLESSSAGQAPQESIPIPAGYVAVTVQLCASEADANYLTAGSRVDVFAIIPVPGAPAGAVQQQCGVSHAGEPLVAANTYEEMGNIEVLSVIEAQPSSSSAPTGSSSAVAADPVSPQLSTGAVAVTLAVTLSQAQILIQVTQLDLPYLALQSTTG